MIPRAGTFVVLLLKQVLFKPMDLLTMESRNLLLEYKQARQCLANGLSTIVALQLNIRVPHYVTLPNTNPHLPNNSQASVLAATTVHNGNLAAIYK